MKHKTLQLDESFVHRYCCEPLVEIRSVPSPHYYYPGGSTSGGKDGILARVDPDEGEAWIGTFAFGELGGYGTSGLYSWPHDKAVCVVARGDGYLVRVDEPSNWELIVARPVAEVLPVPSYNMVVFADLTKLIAYGSTGVVWTSGRLGWDSFDVTEVTSHSIKGRAWDIRTEGYVSFEVRLSSGEHSGGIEV